MNSDLAALLGTLEPALVKAILDRATSDSSLYVKSVDTEERSMRAGLTVRSYARSLEEGSPDAYAVNWRDLSYLRAKGGVPLEQLQALLVLNNEVIKGALKEATASDPARQLQVVEQCAAIHEGALLAVYNGYEQAKDDLIKAQRESIRQLSTPIIPLYTGVLVLPLIGSLDEERASDMTERLLDGITRARASVVIIDVTGVPEIDTSVAEYLLRATRAAELLGAKVVFVGISPRAAQALVQLDVDFEGMMTLSDLQSGIEHALGALGLAIGRRHRGASALDFLGDPRRGLR